MMRASRTLIALGFLLVTSWTLTAADAPSAADLAEFKTVDTAATTKPTRTNPLATVGQPGYLGVHVTAAQGKLSINELAVDSPAAKAGLQKGDVLMKVEGQPVASADALRDLLLAKSPNDSIKLDITRSDKAMEVPVKLGAPSRPMKMGSQRAVLGLRVEAAKDGKGVTISSVSSDSPADKAKLKVGEVVLKIDDIPINEPARLTDYLSERRPDDLVTLTLLLAEKTVDMKLQLAGETSSNEFRSMGWESGRGLGGYFKKPVYKLAVVCVEFPDAKHNAKVTKKDWEESMFSSKTYVNKDNPTGQTVYGSLNDYYQEQSYGALKVEGKVFDWVEVSKKRGDYSQGTGTGQRDRTAMLNEALDKLLARDGKEALKDFDGLYFLYAGDRVQTSRGGLFWPHRASVSHQGKRWAYFIVNEGGSRMNNTSVACHEFGHMLGLPDLYARPENPGSEGLGAWCAMSNQAGNGRPQHFGAWCKEALGWLKPCTIDPTVKQKLILGPCEDSSKECFKVLVKADGSEYFLLENRRKKGFDTSLPAEGLLIWRVVNNKVFLEESHGVDGPSGPRVFSNAVPFPSAANNAFTPYTTPSSRSQLGGGLAVHITNIRQLPDGRVSFYVGYDFE